MTFVHPKQHILMEEKIKDLRDWNRPPTLFLSLFLPNVHLKSVRFNEVLWYKKEGRKEEREEGRKEVYKTKDDNILIDDAKVILLELLRSSEDIR